MDKCELHCKLLIFALSYLLTFQHNNILLSLYEVTDDLSLSIALYVFASLSIK